MRKNHQVWHSVYTDVPLKKVIKSYNPNHFCLENIKKLIKVSCPLILLVNESYSGKD